MWLFQYVDTQVSLQTAKQELSLVEERLAAQRALLKVKTDSIQTIKTDTSVALTQKERELETVAHKLVAQRSRLAATNRECEDAEGKLQDLRRTLAREKAQMQQLRDRVAVAQKQTSLSQDRASGTVQQLDQTRGQLADAQQRLASVEAQVQLKHRELSDLGTMIDSKLAVRDHSSLSSASKQRELRSAEIKLKSLRSTLTLLQQQVDEQNMVYAECEARSRTADEAFLEAEQRKVTMQTEAQKLQLETQARTDVVCLTL